MSASGGLGVYFVNEKDNIRRYSNNVRAKYIGGYDIHARYIGGWMMAIEGVSFNANITPSEIATNDQLEMDIRACLMTWIGIRRNLLKHDPKLEWYSIVSPPSDAEPDEEFLEDSSIIDYMIKNPDYLMGVAMYIIHRMALRGNERGDGS